MLGLCCTIDACWRQHVTARQHLVRTWRRLGLPLVQQFDNEGAFCGGHTHPQVLGQVVRLCLWCGVAVFFTPVYEPKRNHQIETFHSRWEAAFWSRYQFRNLAHVRAEVPLFLRWYHTRYRPPALNGKTPADQNRMALDYAKKYGMRGVGGSDAHQMSRLYSYVTLFDGPIRSVDDLTHALRDGDYFPVHGEHLRLTADD